MTAVYDASLLDISLGGALIEHADIVRPGTSSYLILRIKGRDVNLQCRVIRSMVHRAEMQSDGERMLVYQTGVEFMDPSEQTLRMISDYISLTMQAIEPPLTGP